jgi:hypothetical protein
LKEIDKNDIEDLRVWKNINKQYFFLKHDITPSQQLHWFESMYSDDPDNKMFVVQEFLGDTYVNVGCMGFRKKDYGWDVYNIMRGRKLNSDHKMSTAFMMMNAYISENFVGDICCKVLPGNPARKWYESLGFEIQSTAEEFVFYKLNKSKTPKFELEVNND